MRPVIDHRQLTEAFVAEGVCTAAEAGILNGPGKTPEAAALLDRISRDRDGMLRVARRLDLAGLSHVADVLKATRAAIPTVRETISPEPIPVRGPDHLCPPRQRRRRERARLRAQGVS